MGNTETKEQKEKNFLYLIENDHLDLSGES
jgi:hypothetical protein